MGGRGLWGPWGLWGLVLTVPIVLAVLNPHRLAAATGRVGALEVGGDFENNINNFQQLLLERSPTGERIVGPVGPTQKVVVRCGSCFQPNFLIENSPPLLLSLSPGSESNRPRLGAPADGIREGGSFGGWEVLKPSRKRQNVTFGIISAAKIYPKNAEIAFWGYFSCVFRVSLLACIPYV